MTQLVLNDISFSFGSRKILESFELVVGSSEIVELKGDNGAGKSTVFDLIVGIHQAKNGKLVWCGEEITQLSTACRYNLGIRRLHQHTKLFLEETVVCNIFPFASSQSPDDTLDWLDDLTPGARNLFNNTLEERYYQKAQSLSFGWKKIVEALRVLVSKPKLLLLDEPFAGIPEPVRTWVRDEVFSLVENNGTSVIYIDQESTKSFGATRTINIIS